MEFASELVVKATLAGWRIAEVPTTLQPDGRGRPSHLRSWRDGWRHLRLLLLFSPRWLFLYPGLALLALGIALTTALYFAPLHFLGAGLDIHSMLYASAGALLGMQLCLFALFARVSAQNSGLLPRRPGLDRLLEALTLERGLLLGLLLAVTGLLWSELRRVGPAGGHARHDSRIGADDRRHGDHACLVPAELADLEKRLTECLSFRSSFRRFASAITSRICCVRWTRRSPGWTGRRSSWSTTA
jgi:hypothetical protein